MPLADEAVVEAERAHAVEARVEGVAPDAQRARVVAAHVLEAVQHEAALRGEQVVETVGREQERAGEDVLLDEINAGAERVVARVRAGDELQRHEAVALEHAVADGGEVGEVAVADSLEHLDGDDLVEGAAEVAVILQAHLDAVAEPGGGDAFHREVVLLLRDGERRHAAAVVARGVEAPAAPAGADLEDVVGRREVELAAERVVLCVLRLAQRGVGTLPARGRIHHRVIEPEGEEVVGKVVVLGDVATGDGAVVGAQQVAEPVGAAEEVERERLRALRAGERGRVLDVEDEPADHGREVGRLPIAVEEGLGEADVAAEETFREELGPADAERRDVRDAGCDFARDDGGIAEVAARAVGEFEAQPAVRHAGERAEHGALGEGDGAIGGGKGSGGGLGGRTHDLETGAREACGR